MSVSDTIDQYVFGPVRPSALLATFSFQSLPSQLDLDSVTPLSRPTECIFSQIFSFALTGADDVQQTEDNSSAWPKHWLSSSLGSAVAALHLRALSALSTSSTPHIVLFLALPPALRHYPRLLSRLLAWYYSHLARLRGAQSPAAHGLYARSVVFPCFATTPEALTQAREVAVTALGLGNGSLLSYDFGIWDAKCDNSFTLEGSFTQHKTATGTDAVASAVERAFTAWTAPVPALDTVSTCNTNTSIETATETAIDCASAVDPHAHEDSVHCPIYPGSVVGGTFDHLHGGHLALLTVTALLARARVVVGVTGSAMLGKKKHGRMIATVRDRMADVDAWVSAVHAVATGCHRCAEAAAKISHSQPSNSDSTSDGSSSRSATSAASAADGPLPPCPQCEWCGVALSELSDPYGPSATCYLSQAAVLVVSEETRGGGAAVNKERERRKKLLLEQLQNSNSSSSSSSNGSDASVDENVGEAVAKGELGPLDVVVIALAEESSASANTSASACNVTTTASSTVTTVSDKFTHAFELVGRLSAADEVSAVLGRLAAFARDVTTVLAPSLATDNNNTGASVVAHTAAAVSVPEKQSSSATRALKHALATVLRAHPSLLADLLTLTQLACGCDSDGEHKQACSALFGLVRLCVDAVGIGSVGMNVLLLATTSAAATTTTVEVKSQDGSETALEQQDTSSVDEDSLVKALQVTQTLRDIALMLDHERGSVTEMAMKTAKALQYCL